ncbi:MAG: response regulator transcription factor [Thermomicrobiales bacterium]
MTAQSERVARSERILVVEDDESILELVSTMLRFTGFPVETAVSGSAALAEARNSTFDLLVLDVNLPDIDGFSVCRKLRQDRNDVPVIFLTARDDPTDLRAGFLGGGDDYLTKPFSLEELLFRIEAILRRTLQPTEPTTLLTCDDLSLNDETYRVWRGDEEITLSPTEFRLLRYLLLNQGRVVSKHQILDHVWHYDFGGDPSAVETYVSYLRRKLGDRDAQLIRTVRGFGYILQSA